MKTWQKMLSAVLALNLFLSSTAPVQAAMVGNGAIVQQARAELDRAALREVLSRDVARAQLQALGVSPKDVDARVAAMTDAEVAQVNQHLAQMPAGGDILGLLLILFIVFIITDMLGATDIFPFVHPINK